MGEQEEETNESRSEIARILHQINLEYQAAQRALDGYATVARHAFCTTRTERIAQLYLELQQVAGPEEAIRLAIADADGQQNDKS